MFGDKYFEHSQMLTGILNEENKMTLKKNNHNATIITPPNLTIHSHKISSQGSEYPRLINAF